MALQETDAERKEALLDIAASSFEQAIALEPQNSLAMQAQAEFYRLTDQAEKAEQVLTKSQDPKLLWSHYFRAGRFEDAKRVLKQLYQNNPRDISVVRPLVLLSQRTLDRQGGCRM